MSRNDFESRKNDSPKVVKAVAFNLRHLQEHQQERKRNMSDGEYEPQRGRLSRHHSWGSQSSTSSISSILRGSNKRDGYMNSTESSSERRNVTWKESVRLRTFRKLPDSEIQHLFYDRDELDQFREDAYFKSQGFNLDDYSDI